MAASLRDQLQSALLVEVENIIQGQIRHQRAIASLVRLGNKPIVSDASFPLILTNVILFLLAITAPLILLNILTYAHHISFAKQTLSNQQLVDSFSFHNPVQQ